MGKQKKAEKSTLATLTGEYFQPVRLHYQVFDQKGLLRTFKKLRCLDNDPPRKRWVWLYDDEARHLTFKRSFDQFPAHLHPLVLGSFYLRENDQLLLDLRSCERAELAIPFFDKHIARSVAKVTEAEVVNKLFSVPNAADMHKMSPDHFFDHQVSTSSDPDKIVKHIKDIAEATQDPQEKIRLAMESMFAHGKQALPEIERFPIHYYEDGISGFLLSLRLRQAVALQHWLGNSEYTMFHAIQALSK